MFFQAEAAQQKACDLFEQISDKAKEELIDFKARRIADFRKNLIELAELEIKHAKVSHIKTKFKVIYGADSNPAVLLMSCNASRGVKVTSCHQLI